MTAKEKIMAKWRRKNRLLQNAVEDFVNSTSEAEQAVNRQRWYTLREALEELESWMDDELIKELQMEVNNNEIKVR